MTRVSQPRRDSSTPRPGRTLGQLLHVAVLLTGAVLAFGVLDGIGWPFEAPEWRQAAVMAVVSVLVGAPLSTWIGTAVTRWVRDHLVVLC